MDLSWVHFLVNDIVILQGFGLIQMPIEDKFWSGAIFVKDGKVIPVLNTACR